MKLLVVGGVALLLVLLLVVLPLAARHPYDVRHTRLINEQARLEARIESRTDAAGDAISWPTCRELGAEGCAYRRVRLRQRDFAHGTVRLLQPCLVELAEDITFSPNYNHDHRVSEAQRVSGEYPVDSGFVLNFFAAITVETHDVIIDLRGHTLKSSELFAAKQAFYSHIELASAPFIMGQGPAVFGSSFVAAHDVVVRNGQFGRSQHHAVHGNGASNVFLHSLYIVDYEVASIALNGCENVLVSDVRAMGMFAAVPELGTLSQARFLLPFMQRLADQDEMLGHSYHRLRALTEQAAHDIEHRGTIDKQAHPEAYKLFANEQGPQDGGSAYGMIVTDLGIAVHAFGTEYINGQGSRNVVLADVHINGTLTQAREVLATRTADSTPVQGPVGDVVEFERVLQHYDGLVFNEPLTHAQLALASAVERHVPASDRRHFGTLNIPSETIDWFRATDGGRRHIGAHLRQLFRDKVIHYTRSGDLMDHFSKGSIGLRVDSSLSVLLRRVRIDNTEALGAAGKRYDMPGEAHADELDHPLQVPFVGYRGHVATGLLLAGSLNVVEDDVTIGRVHSRHGDAIERLDLGSTK